MLAAVSRLQPLEQIPNIGADGQGHCREAVAGFLRICIALSRIDPTPANQGRCGRFIVILQLAAQDTPYNGQRHAIDHGTIHQGLDLLELVQGVIQRVKYFMRRYQPIEPGFWYDRTGFFLLFAVTNTGIRCTEKLGGDFQQ
ncbi:MAG: hypothetical protein KA137_02315 [Halioglobus sp.]|nr:hypothetical protein [Halioglobus sp.]